MEDFKVEGTKGIFFTPSVHLQAGTGICEILGESYIEDAPSFYEPILSWLKEYTETQKKELTFNFKLTYFNTSSSKSLLHVIKQLKYHKEQGFFIEINWYYPDDNYDLLAEAEDFMEDIELKFNLIPYKLDY